jgi:hypothetical protein
LCQASTAMCMVAASRSSTLHDDADFNCVQLFSFYFGLWLCGDGNSIACVSIYNVTMHTSPLKLLFFTSFLTQNNFFYFSFDATYYIEFHTSVAPNIMFNFSLMLHVKIILMCFTLVVPFLCILPLFWLSS